MAPTGDHEDQAHGHVRGTTAPMALPDGHRIAVAGSLNWSGICSMVPVDGHAQPPMREQMSVETREPTMVFLPLWEYQCCGEPVAVGRTYAWWVVPSEAESAWNDLIDGQVSLLATHHAMEPGTAQVRVRVNRLWVATAVYERHEGGLAIVAGSARLVGADVMDPWDEDVPGERGGLDMAGWIAEVTVLDDLPGYVPDASR